MPGPLRPAWVTRTGPSVFSFVPRAVTCAFSTETPARSDRRGSMMWKVKSEGTGGTTVCPKDSAMASPPEALLPPVATMTRSKASVEPLPRVRRKDSASLMIVRTGVETRMVTPARAAADIRQSTIVPESSVVGNIRPSSSVFVATPRLPNHSMVSLGWKRWKAPRSSRPPRGYFFTSSFGSKQEWVTLHRPPPEMRTLASRWGVASKRVTLPA